MDRRLSAGPLTVRPLVIEDVDAYYNAVCESLPDLSRWLAWAHEGYVKSETIDFLETSVRESEAGNDHAYGIFDAQTNEVLGGTGLHLFDPGRKQCHLGYWVKSGVTRQGIASRAATRLAQFAFDDLGVIRIEILVAVGNEPSLRVAQKIGALREGIARKRLWVQDTWSDAVVHSLLAEDLIS